MSHDSRISHTDTLIAIQRRIEDAIPGCDVQVAGGGGHFTISVTSEMFNGKRTLQRKRMVYSAITELMAGDDAPVHAVDYLETKTP